MPIDEDMNVNPEYEDKKGADLDELGQLEAQMDKLQIKMIGKDGDDEEDAEKYDAEESSEDELDLDPNDFQPSKRHQNYTSIEERAREDMEFRDEVDTPLDMNARD